MRTDWTNASKRIYKSKVRFFSGSVRSKVRVSAVLAPAYTATVRRLKLEYPMLVTNYDVNSTFDTLKFFVRAVANADEWKANEFV